MSLLPSMAEAEIITQTPLIEEVRLQAILKEVYGIQECRISKLSGYDALNFRLDGCQFDDRAHSDLVRHGGSSLVVKFTNPLEAQNEHLLNGQIALADWVRARGIPTPATLPTIEGNLWQNAQMTDTIAAPVLLMSFMSGDLVESVGYSLQLFRLLGRTMGEFHNATVDFVHPYFAQGDCHFLCSEKPVAFRTAFELLVARGKIVHPEQIDLCRRAFDDLERDFDSRRSHFASGVIHADFNEDNIIVRHVGAINGSETDLELEVSGLLDFGDSHYSALVNDVAALIAYMALASKLDWRIVRTSVLTGYSERREARDLDVLLVAMRGSLVRMLVYAVRTATLNVRNEDLSYVLKGQDAGWELLKVFTKAYDQEKISFS